MSTVVCKAIYIRLVDMKCPLVVVILIYVYSLDAGLLKSNFMRGFEINHTTSHNEDIGNFIPQDYRQGSLKISIFYEKFCETTKLTRNWSYLLAY